MPTPNLKEIATGYAKRGWRVFPCQPRNKQPLRGSNGYLDAVTDCGKIAEWWTAIPDANVAIACGDASGIVVIDVDVSDSKCGMESWQRLKAEFDLPDTLTARTGSGGLHLFFGNPRGLTNSNAALKDRYPYLDVRGEGGYVIAPGSVHPDGGIYEWIEGNAPIAPLPDKLREFLQQKRATRTTPSGLASNVVGKGGRNNFLTSTAGKMRRHGLDAEAILAALLSVNERECQPPLSQDEVRTIAYSVARYEPKSEERFTELFAAETFIKLHGDNIRYHLGTKKWLLWSGERWESSADEQVLALVSQLGRHFAREAERINDDDHRNALLKFANTVEKQASIRSILKLAAANEMIWIRASDLDNDLYLINFRNGTLDLRSGKLGQHSRLHYITTMVDMDFDPEASAPRWEQFLSEVFSGRPEELDYLQRYLGYGLCGDVSDQSMMLWVGLGANGKSVLASAIRDTLSGYAEEVAPESLIAQGPKSTRSDLVRLRSARLVFSSETNEDQKMDESLLKRLSGGDSIVARTLYATEESFRPTFRLVLLTNSFPSFTGDDSAIWRRLRVVEFKRIFALSEQDAHLGQKLATEKQGIMAWLVSGFLRYQKVGLKPTAAMTEHLQSLRESADSVGTFIASNCREGAGRKVRAKVLYQRFTSWCIEEGLPVISQKRLGGALTRKGFRSRKSNGVTIWDGLELASYSGVSQLG